MIRRIIKIDKEKCDGCGLCVTACHEGAIGLADGKATLLRDDYCDGLGDCLPSCPTGAITFENREALAFNEEEVKKNMEFKKKEKIVDSAARQSMGSCLGSGAGAASRLSQGSEVSRNIGGCPGANVKEFSRVNEKSDGSALPVQSQLRQWPVQIKLVPVTAAYFDHANLLVSADCAAYAYGNFHQDFLRNSIAIIGCPKLDSADYSQKLAEILSSNNIKSVTVVRMEVPCCAGIEHAVVAALKNCGKMIPWKVVTISTDGRVLD